MCVIDFCNTYNTSETRGDVLKTVMKQVQESVKGKALETIFD